MLSTTEAKTLMQPMVAMQRKPHNTQLIHETYLQKFRYTQWYQQYYAAAQAAQQAPPGAPGSAAPPPPSEAPPPPPLGAGSPPPPSGVPPGTAAYNAVSQLANLCR
jgi:hypothetical protein